MSEKIPNRKRPSIPARKVDLRQSARKRGYTWNWEKARSRFLASNPACVLCWSNGIATRATVVDHIVPHRGNQELFWDVNNWQPLCEKCHNKKTGSGK